MKHLITNWRGHLVILLFLSISVWSCNDVVQLNETEESSPEISEIDGKPIITISDADYYQGQSTYINKVMDGLSENGRAIVEAMNTQLKDRTNKLQSTETDAIIVGLSDLKSTTSYKSISTSSNNSLVDLSSHIRIIDDDGDIEEFELILQPHYGSYQISNSSPVALSADNTWLALGPDRFYVQEDAEGNEIWPVNFPAVSLDDPGREIVVTLDRDGKLTWPSGIQGKSNSTSSGNQMIYVDNLANLKSCSSGSDTQIESCGGGGGGGGSGTPRNDPNRFVNSEIKTASFLALKTIRLDGTGDGDKGSELQMHVEPYSSYNEKFKKNWNFVFDHKRGMTNRPLWFDDFSLRGIIVNGYRLYNDLSGELRSSATSVFSDRNTRTFAADSRIYETPDVNFENRDYNFTNMRSWSYLFLPTFESGYSEGSRLNYFPIVPLGNFAWRVLLMEDDRKYPYQSGNGRTTLAHNVWTFNMSNGNYNNIYTKVSANSHSNGSSDDLMWHSGISHITQSTVDQRLRGRTEIRTLSPGGFKYVLKKIDRTAEFRPSN